AGEAEIEVPLDGGPYPRSAEKAGLKATVKSLTVQGRDAQLALEVEGPSNTTLMNAVNDGTYGVALLNREGRPAIPGGGTMTQPRPNLTTYRLGFQTLRGEP